MSAIGLGGALSDQVVLERQPRRVDARTENFIADSPTFNAVWLAVPVKIGERA